MMTYEEYETYITTELEHAADNCLSALLRLQHATSGLPSNVPDHYLRLLYLPTLSPNQLLANIIARNPRAVEVPYPYNVELSINVSDDFNEFREPPADTFEFIADQSGVANPDLATPLYEHLTLTCGATSLAADPNSDDIIFSITLLHDADYDGERLAARIAAGNINSENITPAIVHSFNVTTLYLQNIIAQAAKTESIHA